MKLIGPLRAGVTIVVGPASATELTSPKGTKLAVGAVVKVKSTNATLDGSVKIACKEASGEGSITNAGGPGATVSGLPNLVVWQECAGDTITVLSTGSGEVHSLGGGEGTLTSSGAEITVQIHRTVLGIPVTTHCIYVTSNTDIGTFTSSTGGSSNATIHLKGAKLRVLTDSACGEDGVMTGTYTVTSPVPLYLS